MANPNNCKTCDHSKYAEGGHCYMFRNEPTDICMQHTARKVDMSSFWKAIRSVNISVEPPKEAQ